MVLQSHWVQVRADDFVPATSCARLREHNSARTELQGLTLVSHLAGCAWTIDGGDFYAFKCHEACTAVVVRWMLPLGVIHSIYNLAIWYESYEEERCRAFLRRGRMILPEAWMGLLEGAINTHFGATMNVPFEIKTSVHGGSTSVGYNFTRDVTPCMRDETDRGGEIFLLGAIANMLGVCKRLSIDKIQRRWWGKLTVWCKTQMGLSTHQKERDRVRGGRPSTDYRGPRGGRNPEEESGSSGADDDGQ